MLFSGTGRHRRTRVNIVKAVVATTGVAGAAVALPLIGASGANAATVSTWDKVAQCESGGDWSINTGNGFYGGLQLGGGAYASTANHASKAAQITVAERVLASQGPGAWPVCGPRAGLHKGGPAPVVGGSSPTTKSKATTKVKAKSKSKKVVAHKPVSKPVAQHHTTGAGSYTVKPGDTLSKIAAAHHVAGGWQALYAENRAVIGGNPNVIHVGEKLVIK